MVSLLTAEQQHRRVGSAREVSPISVDWDPLWREHVMSYRRQHDGDTSSTEHVATFPTLAFMQVMHDKGWGLTDVAVTSQARLFM